MGLADKMKFKYSPEEKHNKMDQKLHKQRVKSLIGRKIHEENKHIVESKPMRSFNMHPSSNDKDKFDNT